MCVLAFMFVFVFVFVFAFAFVELALVSVRLVVVPVPVDVDASCGRGESECCCASCAGASTSRTCNSHSGTFSDGLILPILRVTIPRHSHQYLRRIEGRKESCLQLNSPPPSCSGTGLASDNPYPLSPFLIAVDFPDPGRPTTATTIWSEGGAGSGMILGATMDVSIKIRRGVISLARDPARARRAPIPIPTPVPVAGAGGAYAEGPVDDVWLIDAGTDASTSCVPELFDVAELSKLLILDIVLNVGDCTGTPEVDDDAVPRRG